MFKTTTLKQGLTIIGLLTLQACGFEQNFLGGSPNIPINHNPPINGNGNTDTTAPSAPTITSPVAGDKLDSNHINVTGECETGATVSISGDIVPSPTTGSCVSGTYTIGVTITSGDGIKNLSVTQTDAAGNTSSATSLNYTLDTSAPSAPTVASPTTGATLNGTSQTVTGTCETGATVSISGNVVPNPTTGTCVGGAYSIGVTLTPGDGVKNLSAIQTDAANNTSTATNFNYTLDTTPPSAPTISSPSDGSSLHSTSQTITGTCESGATVAIAGNIVGSPTTGLCVGGNYSIGITLTSGDGTKNITATQTDIAGNASTFVSVFYHFDTTSPNAPTVDSPADTSLLNSTSQTISGTCEAGATVTISGNITGSPITGFCVGGNYSIGVTLTSGDGTKNITVNQTDLAGNSSTDASVSYTLDTNANAPTVDSPVNGVTLHAAAQTISGTCETGATVSITNAVVGSPVTGTCVGGAYSINVTLTSGDGTKNITVAQTDLAGNTSSDTDVSYTLDTITYTLGGTITGLPPGRSIEVTDIISAQSFTITNNPNTYTGNYTFPTSVYNGDTYDVSMTVGLNNPFGYDDSHISCTMQNAQGTVSGANVTDINVVCECGNGAQQAYSGYSAEGSGSSGDPFLIYTPQQFVDIVNNNNPAWGAMGSPVYYKQKCDLDFTSVGATKPIGDSILSASIIWNGDLHDFFNYTNSDSDPVYAGVFGNMIQSEFRDMTIRDAQISTANAQNAGFIGYCEDCKIVTIYADNIQVNGSANSLYVGSLLGSSNGGSNVYNRIYLKNSAVTSPHGFLSPLFGWGKIGNFTHIMLDNVTATDTDESDSDKCGAVAGFWDGPTLNIVGIKNTTITCGNATGLFFDATNGSTDQTYFSGTVTSSSNPSPLLSGFMEGGINVTNSFTSSPVTVSLNGFGNNVSLNNSNLSNVSYNSDIGYGCQGVGTCTPDQPGVTPQPDTTKFYLSPANGGDASMNTWDFPNEWCEIPGDFPAVFKVPFSPCQ